MARSSGGGSRSGGSRGGSRSSRSRGGSRGSGTRTVYSSTPAAGCSKYQYVDRRGRTRYVWCNYDITQKPKANTITRIILTLFYIPFFIAIIGMIASTIDIPRPIDKRDNPDALVYIDDRELFLDETYELNKSLSAFYEKTGVTPAVITVCHEDWQPYYTSLEQYALEQYYLLFEDEYHWLIIYSVPRYEEFKDWDWEGIIGDDTTKAISDARCDQLTDTLQENLYRGKGLSYALTETFNDMTASYKTQINIGMIPITIFVTAFITLHYCLMTGIIGGRKYHTNAVKIEDAVVEQKIIKCKYCDGTYGSDVTLACPHCNAPVTIDETAL